MQQPRNEAACIAVFFTLENNREFRGNKMKLDEFRGNRMKLDKIRGEM